MGLSNFRGRCCSARHGLLSVLLVASLCACMPAPEQQTADGLTMGTYYRVSTRCAVPDLAQQVAATLERINGLMSNYDAGSTLSAVNGAQADDWISVPAELMQVLQAAQAVYQQSAGAFDVTIAPVLRLWGFGPNAVDPRTQVPPDDETLALARARVGMQHVTLDPDGNRLRRLHGVEFDLSAIAKGYAVDALSELLRTSGCHDHLVDVGGEVRANGTKGDGVPWRIGIEVPRSDTIGAVQRVLQLRDQAVATSGDYRNFIEQDDARWSHTIDPRTGAPVAHPLASVTVVHPSAMLADAWATALNVLGPQAALAVAEKEGLSVLLIVRDAAGFQERYNEAFEAFIAPP